MGEVKTKMNINKLTVKNLFLLVLLMVIIAVSGVISKLIGSKDAKTSIAQAQGSCWVAPSCESCGDGASE